MPKSIGQAPKFDAGRQVATVQTNLITEASGIVASRKNAGVLWVHNDSGDLPRIYALNTKGQLLGIYQLKEARLRDCEDIALCRGPDPNSDYLYIGDIGDNKARREFVTVYRVREPKVDLNQTLVKVEIGPVVSLNLEYPDRPKDAETLMVDPLSGDIYIISKRDLFAKVYRAKHPHSREDRIIMDRVAVLPWGFVVGGDVSPDGSLVIVRGLNNASIWQRSDDQELWQAFLGKQSKVQLLSERQGEGICFDSHGRGYFTIGEMSNPPLHYFGRLEASTNAHKQTTGK
ncbi:MAG: hypothetical protein ACXABY_34045 [Candidatus Thorarchaeota archaeon]